LGGAFVGSTPGRVNSLAPGKYKVEVKKEGYNIWSQTIDVHKGSMDKLTANLKKGRLNQEDDVIQDSLRDGSNDPEMVVVQPGCFQIGLNTKSNKRTRGASDENSVHQVCFKEPFAIGKYEVTQKQWTKLMGYNPSGFKCDDCPVEKVSWVDVLGFINKLNQQTGAKYRLPTEAEWEYACRSGGRDVKYCGGNSASSLAWYNVNSGRKTHQVGTKQANDLGIYDMSGNVWEWVADCWSVSHNGAPTDGSINKSGDCSRRVNRGGSSIDSEYYMRSAGRRNGKINNYSVFTGFRLSSNVQMSNKDAMDSPIPKPKKVRLYRAGDVFQDSLSDGSHGPEMVVVKPGCYLMGSTLQFDTNGGRTRVQNPAQKVCVKIPFAIGKFEVTQRLWKKIMGSNPSRFKCDDCPVEKIGLNDIQGFIKKLNQQTGANYRLPTEAEWEYACRSGGKDENFCGGNSASKFAWYHGNSSGITHKVGTKQANGLGIFDMSGNVKEWIADCWNEPYQAPVTDDGVLEPEDCSHRVLRGGSWAGDSTSVLSAFRSRGRTNFSGREDIGFRLARSF
jgi:formylglycine-generating enzyme required for sulfatase activity